MIYMISRMMQRVKEMVVVVILAVFSKAVNGGREASETKLLQDGGGGGGGGGGAAVAATYCLSWRLGVEANNIRGWRTVPAQCFHHIQHYMIGGQYERDLNLIMDQVYLYLNEILVSDDGLDAWILDVDDTCISNVFYYKTKRFGCDPFDPVAFKTWASKAECSSVAPVLTLFNKLVASGFKVFLVTGRGEETLGQPTLFNLLSQGFLGFERLILRNASYKGQSAVAYKSAIRKQLVDEGYRIWANIGDQWSDLLGDFVGNRTFKLPNPMYFVP